MIINNSGGAAPLNFKVVGGTAQPNSPSENTIWVNTASPITSWVFSAGQPENPAEGMLWFTSSTTCNSPINAIKKNGLWVYPTACKQYANGEWLTKSAKVYQNGAWRDVRLPIAYMFNNGDLGESGGFQSSAGTLTVNSLITHKISSGNYAFVTSKNQIDLTGFSTITFNCMAGGVVKEYACVGVGKTPTAFVAEKSATQTSYADVSIDIKSLTGLHYVGFKNKSYSENNGCEFYVKSILLS